MCWKYILTDEIRGSCSCRVYIPVKLTDNEQTERSNCQGDSVIKGMSDMTESKWE